MDGEILFLCHRIPFPPDRGDKIRSFHMLRALANIAPVHVGTFADDERDASFAGDLARISASQKVVARPQSRAIAGLRGLILNQPMLLALYHAPALHHWVAQTMAQRPIRAVVAYSVQMAAYVPMLAPGQSFLMDFVDFDSAKYAAYGAEQGGVMGWVNRREGRKLLAYERSVAQRATRSTFVSQSEAGIFRQTVVLPKADIRALENGVDLAYFDPRARFQPVAKGQGPLIVFTGQCDYRPNIEAVSSFVRETLPLVQAVHPDARFAIVGRAPTPEVMALAAVPGVTVTGAVPDVRGWLAAADLVVAPLRIARGIQNKVLEAMAMARPTIASAQAAEGIDAVAGKQFLVARDAAEEARMALELLADPIRADALGIAARARMVERYDWAATLAPLQGYLTP